MSDTHFSHENILKITNRPFSSIAEMNEVILDNIHKCVTKQDQFIFVGDWSWDFNFGVKAWNSINAGLKCFVRGNHDDLLDRDDIINMESILDVNRKIEPKAIFTVCHYPMVSWNKSHYGTFQVHGHHHNQIIAERFPGKRVNVAVENTNYMPIELEEVLAIVKTLPDNWDMVRKPDGAPNS
jgi:calcineurin-like phosphoesterase family protein